MYSVSEYNNVKYILAESSAGEPPHWADCLKEYYAPWPVLAAPGHLRVDVDPDSMIISYIKAVPDGNDDNYNGLVMDQLNIDQPLLD